MDIVNVALVETGFSDCYIVPHVCSTIRSSVISDVHNIVLKARLCLRRLDSRHLLVQRQDIRHRTQRSDSEWVDLAVAFGVVLLDVSELGRAAESLVVPIKVAQPPGRESQYCGSTVDLVNDLTCGG